MRARDTSLFSILGLVYWGDVGPITCYKSKRGKVVAFLKTWPKKPPSEAQQEQRDRFTAAATAWQALTLEQQAQWHLASQRASLCMHGYDLFVHWHMLGDDDAIATLERQTKTDLLP